MGGSNQSLFILAAIVLAQGTAAVPLLIVGLLLAWMALPGWLELVLMWPGRVGGIAATCAEAFRPYSAVLANLTGVCYWWGWVPTCGLTALLAAGALHGLVLGAVPVPVIAIAIIVVFVAINLCGVQWVARTAVPLAVVSAGLAFASAIIPVVSGRTDWHRSFDFQLLAPYPGFFGAFTSAMAGLYLIGFAAPAFEAAACHVGETKDPARNVPRAMLASAGMATLFFAVLPIIWLGTIGPSGLAGDLATTLGPTFAPLVGAGAKAAATMFLVFNMLHGTLQPLAGAARTLSQLADDGLLPRALGRRLRTDAPWVATVVTALAAIAFLLAGDPTWVVAAANLTYLIGIGLPSVAVWLLRKNAPLRPRPYRAPTWMLRLGLVAAAGWALATVFGFEQYGMPTVVFGIALAYSGSVLYAIRVLSDRRRDGIRTRVRSLHLKLTGSMLLVLSLDGLGYMLALSNMRAGDPALVSALKDVFVAVALLTLTVGLVLPGMIAHASGEVMRAAQRLERGTLLDLSSGLEALARADLDSPRIVASTDHVIVHSRDEIGAMASSFNAMVDEASRAAAALERAREQLRRHTEHLEVLVAERTRQLERANGRLVEAQSERGQLLDESIRALEEQRTVLAADLHDGPIQRLAAVRLLLDRVALAAARGDTGDVSRHLERSGHLVETEIDALRVLMSGLRPPVLGEGGIAAALGDELDAFSRRTGIAAGGSRQSMEIDDKVAVVLYRIAQAALANIERHAAASRVEIDLHREGDSVRLEVRDDGTGFDVARIPQLVRNGHFGIAGMRERAQMVDGRLDVASHLSGGTSIVVRIPCGPGVAERDPQGTGASAAMRQPEVTEMGEYR